MGRQEHKTNAVKSAEKANQFSACLKRHACMDTGRHYCCSSEERERVSTSLNLASKLYNWRDAQGGQRRWADRIASLEIVAKEK